MSLAIILRSRGNKFDNTESMTLVYNAVADHDAYAGTNAEPGASERTSSRKLRNNSLLVLSRLRASRASSLAARASARSAKTVKAKKVLARMPQGCLQLKQLNRIGIQCKRA